MLVHVGIERRQGQPAEFYRVAVLVFPEDDVGAGFLIFQLNFITHQLDIFPARRIRRSGGNHKQANACAFLSANHFDDFVESHLANIDVFRRALRHGSDAVADLEPSVRLRGATDNQTLDFRVTIFGAKHRADAHE